MLLALFFIVLLHSSSGAVDGPRMLSSSSHVKVLQGKGADLPCTVAGAGIVRVWRRLPATVLFSGWVGVSRVEGVSVGGAGELLLRETTPLLAGEYECHVHGHPLVRVVHRVDVLVAPSLDCSPRGGVVTVRRDSPVAIVCHVSGSPAPEVTWTFQQGASLPGGARRAADGRQLLISSADSLHAGHYACAANNGVEPSSTVEFTLVVQHVPEVSVFPDWQHADEGATIEVTCSVEATPPASLAWLRGGADGRLLQSDARTRLTYDQQATPRDPARSTLRMRWLRRDDLGRYTCLATNLVGNSSKTFEISGLAEASVLDGEASEEGGFLLRWSTRSLSPVVEFRLKIRQSGQEGWRDVTVPGSGAAAGGMHWASYAASGLRPGAPYQALVLAHNHFGWSPPPRAPFAFTAGGELSTEEAEESTQVNVTPQYHLQPAITEPTFLKQESSARSFREGCFLPVLCLISLLV